MATWLDRRTMVALATIVVAFGVTGLKYVSYRLTGSVALYSDAIESIVNIATAFAALWAIRVSRKPADRQHQFGHHKAEYFSAVLEGVLIIVAALLIIREAWLGWNAPRLSADLSLGMLVNASAALINGVWALFLLRYGRRHRSPALVADGWHLVTDVFTSAGVLVGLLLVAATGLAWLDPALAVLVAINIVWSGWKVIRESVGGLMDHAVPPELETRIRETISRHAEGAIEVHDLRTRNAGRASFIEFHLVVPGAMTVTAAHVICDRLEAALAQVVDDAEVVIHVEPEGEAQHQGVLVL
ncbi:cation diffusion facilitator family transporter [Prosthecomicrobium pneumaticum]|uniref:Protein p34 n=1 Tax=Prosthecomicrobium pneumaticum TaxID=81895 RepID=A0A7W9L309_9HYPH|nr:cation diffusion facilitator family transporter [Prosthecomicrobium pneumaticum]